MRREGLVVVVALRGAPRVKLPQRCGEVLLSTEDERYAADPCLPAYDSDECVVQFQRQGAVVLAYRGECVS